MSLGEENECETIKQTGSLRVKWEKMWIPL